MPKVSWKGGALLAPLPPVLVSCGNSETGETNILTVAWTGIINTKPPRTYISVRPCRHSHHIIKESGEFVLNLTTESLVKSADYCGIYTGKKVDKFEKCHLTREESKVVSCPSIAESPLSIECKVTQIIPMESHDMFLAEIVAVNVSEELLNSDGKLCLDRASLAAFAHGEYFALGKKLGYFGYSTKKKTKNKRKK
ncbi:MAG: flavin reductase family protein [Clostridia bacterium]|nr:flavin reductase family protein [Clostridia bacterium]